MDATTQAQKLGPYRLDVLLGRGGMGEVYKAWDTRLERWVAVKRLRTDRASPEDRERFRREARAAAQLGHPAILQVFDVLEDDGDWIVMEMVDGPDLATLVEDGPLAPLLVVDYGRQIAEGLAAAHAQGIVHRDLKTQNVMVLPSGRSRPGHLKILDFGLARKLDADESRPGLAGTPRAMSPEQAQGRDVDARSDLFSLGVLLYELLTARSPFQGFSVGETLHRVVTYRQLPVRDFAPWIPPALSDLVDHLLEKDRRHRPPSAEAVAEALAEIAAGRASEPPEADTNATTLGPVDPPGDAAVRRRVPTLRPWTPPAFPAEPYPVLLPYTHPDLLVGREDDLDDLTTALRTQVLVTGLHAASGTGKSSLLLAGLVPRLGAAGRPVALVRHPCEAGVASRLLADLLDDAEPVADDDWQGFVDRLAEAERLAGTQPVLVLDQFEDVLRSEETTARRTLGVLLAATARRRPGLLGGVCRWLLSYRKEYHGEVVAWLGDVLCDARDAGVSGVGSLPHDLSGPERFQDFALSPLGTPPAGGDDDEIRKVFQKAIERPFELRQDSGEPRYRWRFAPGHAECLALSFTAARRRRPDAPLTPELQVVLAHLLSQAGEDGVLRLPETGNLVDEALEIHLKRALESAFPGGSRTDRSRALLALRELATSQGRRDEGLPVEALAKAVGDDGEEVLARLATPLTRLIVPWSSPEGPRYVLAHDRMAEVVVRVVEEEGQQGGLLVDSELLALRRFVALKTALHRSGQANATRVPRRHYRRIGVHAEALLWDEERRSWWSACRRRRRSDRRRAVAGTTMALVVLLLVTWGAWRQARDRQERLDLLERVSGGEPEAALLAVQELLDRGDTEPEELLEVLKKTEVAMDVLERGLGAVEGEERSVLVLTVVELALPWVEEAPEDPELIANLVWALDYGPGRDPAYVAQAIELRDRVLEPLRKLKPPPSIQVEDPDWVEVPAGTFLMGSPAGEGDDDEHPQHEVRISAFRILRHEVTNAEFRRLVPDHPTRAMEEVAQDDAWRSTFKSYRIADDLPAGFLSWYQAYTYAAWIGGRLPTEAEWEYAARADCPYAYCNRNGNEAAVEDVAWTKENSPTVPVRDTTQPILSPGMTLEPNPWGIYDMLGSLSEWNIDWYAAYPEESTAIGIWGHAAPSGDLRMIRGGGFLNDAAWARAAQRIESLPSTVYPHRGVRVVLPGGQRSGRPELMSLDH